MGSGSITSAPVPVPKALGKNKKKENRLARLKQCKIDVRREQWIPQSTSMQCFIETSMELNYRNNPSHVELLLNASLLFWDADPDKSKRYDVNSNGMGQSLASSVHISDKNKTTTDNSKTRPGGMLNPGLSLDGSSLCQNDPMKLLGSSSSSSCEFCSGSTGGDQDEEDECLDDWEAIADDLTTHCDDGVGGGRNPVTERPGQSVIRVTRAPSPSPDTCPAWRPDDEFRPQSLPSLSKQHSSPPNHGGPAWQGVLSPQLLSCPICCEDLDLTDSRFFPCLCGFRVCLFCHNRILEVDGRCPGCRKEYDSSVGRSVPLHFCSSM